MEYPGNFDTPAFPAGKRIAVSRVVGIGILSVFFLVSCMCGLVLWGARSMRLEPFLISVDDITGVWSVVGRNTTTDKSYPVTQTMQESVAVNFTQNWFSISDDASVNGKVWRQCPVAECTGAESLAYGVRDCAISCMAGDKLFKVFTTDVVPVYKSRAMAGETWGVMADSIQASHIGETEAGGGIWRIRASVWSNINSVFEIVAFVRVARAVDRYPMTMGYYVEDFNSYRISL